MKQLFCTLAVLLLYQSSIFAETLKQEELSPNKSLIESKHQEAPLQGNIVVTPEQHVATKSLTLEQAIETALKYHPRLQQATGQILSNKADYKITRSQLFPEVHAIVSGSNGPPGLPVINGLNGLVGGFVDFGTAVNLVWTPWDFGRTWHQARAAKQETLSAEQSLQAVRNKLVLDATQAYYHVIAQQKLASVMADIFKSRQLLTKQAKLFADKGLRSMVDFQVAKTMESQAQQLLLEAKNAGALAFIKLNQAMGLDSSEPYQMISSLPQEFTLPAGDLEQFVQEAFTKRPELKAMAFRLKGAEQSKISAKRGHFPETRLVAGGGYVKDNLAFTDRNHNRYGAVGGFVRQPLFTGGLITGRIDKASAQEIILGGQAQELRQSIRAEVTQAYLQLQNTVQQIQVAEEQVKAAREAYRLSKQRYRLELGDMVQVTQAEANLFQSESQLLQAHLGYLNANAAFTFAYGESR